MKYVSKPLVVDAMQFKEDNLKEVICWLESEPAVTCYRIGHNGLVVSTIKKMVQAEHGEYLIKRNDVVEILDSEDFEERFCRPTLLIMKSRYQGKIKSLKDWKPGRRGEFNTIKINNEYRVKDRT